MDHHIEKQIYLLPSLDRPGWCALLFPSSFHFLLSSSFSLFCPGPSVYAFHTCGLGSETHYSLGHPRVIRIARILSQSPHPPRPLSAYTSKIPQSPDVNNPKANPWFRQVGPWLSRGHRWCEFENRGPKNGAHSSPTWPLGSTFTRCQLYICSNWKQNHVPSYAQSPCSASPTWTFFEGQSYHDGGTNNLLPAQ